MGGTKGLDAVLSFAPALGWGFRLGVAAEASARLHDGFGMAAALHFHRAADGLDVGEGAIRIADGVKRLPRPP